MTTENTESPFNNAGLWEEPWTPTRREGEALAISQIVQEAVGSASMCWENVYKAGIFNSERAEWVAGGAIAAIERAVWQQQNPIAELCTEAAPEAGIAELSEEGKQWQIQRKADQAELIAWILHYKNPVDDETKLRQIKLVIE
jgi:hypothetical protein